MYLKRSWTFLLLLTHFKQNFGSVTTLSGLCAACNQMDRKRRQLFCDFMLSLFWGWRQTEGHVAPNIKRECQIKMRAVILMFTQTQCDVWRPCVIKHELVSRNNVLGNRVGSVTGCQSPLQLSWLCWVEKAMRSSWKLWKKFSETLQDSFSSS